MNVHVVGMVGSSMVQVVRERVLKISKEAINTGLNVEDESMCSRYRSCAR